MLLLKWLLWFYKISLRSKKKTPNPYQSKMSSNTLKFHKLNWHRPFSREYQDKLIPKYSSDDVCVVFFLLLSKTPFDTFSLWLVNINDISFFPKQMNFIQVFFNGFPLDSYQNSQLFVKYPRNSKRTMININVWNQEKNVMFVKICSHIHTLLTMNWRTVSIFGWFVYGFQYTHTSITCQFVLESVHFGRVLCSLFESFLVLKSTVKRWMEMYSDFHENVWLRKKAKKNQWAEKIIFFFPSINIFFVRKIKLWNKNSNSFRC